MSAMNSACDEYRCPCHDDLLKVRAENERLRAALERIERELPPLPKDYYPREGLRCIPTAEAIRQVRDALGKAVQG